MVESVLHQQATELRGAFSKLQQERITSKCIKPSVVLSGTSHVVAEKEALGAKNHHDKIEALFPNTYGKPRVELSTGDAANAITKALRLAVVLSGGQAPGGHNVIAGVFDYAMKCSPESKVFGFLNGPGGVMGGIFCEVSSDCIPARHTLMHSLQQYECAICKQQQY
jgi:diphosphate-dependent phosphofructokinase